MGLSLLQICLFVNIVCHTLATQVTRRPNGDVIVPQKCSQSCKGLNAKCNLDKKRCCMCQCLKKTTYYYSKSAQTCVKPNEIDQCKYHFEPSKDWVDLFKTKSKDLLIYHREVKLFSYTCKLKKQQLWNLVKWEDIKNTKDAFKVEKDSIDYKITLPKKDAKVFEGQLVKIIISCVNGRDKEESCIIFKVIGRKNYTVDIAQKIITTTLPPVTTRVTTKVAAIRKSDFVIPVIIGVTVAILVTIGILVICWCWKKRRKAKKGGDREFLNYGEDPNYQPTDGFSMRAPSEIHGSANNVAYLQPVDAGVPYSNRNTQNRAKGNNGRVKNHNYDYPDINSLSQKSSVPGSIRPRPKDAPGVEKPIYAEVGDIKPTTPEYSDPDHLINKKRVDSELVSVPGYAPSSGPYHDEVSTYSSLGVVSDDSSVYQALLDPDDPTGSKPRPKGPEYAVVESEPVEHDDEEEEEEEEGDIII